MQAWLVLLLAVLIPTPSDQHGHTCHPRLDEQSPRGADLEKAVFVGTHAWRLPRSTLQLQWLW